LVAELSALALVTTVDVYHDADGWHPERQELHGHLVAGQLGAGAAPPDPVAYFTIGPMGSGKSSRLRRLVERHRVARGRTPKQLYSRVAADEIRVELPEYADGLGSEVVHIECLEVTYSQVFPAAVDAHHDIVFDTIGTIGADGSVSFDPSLAILEDAGYEIHVLLADAPLDTCVQRATERALHVDGRLVDAAAHAATHPQPSEVLRLLRDRGRLAGWAVVDTSSEDDSLPIRIGTDDWIDLA
jgi:hypothetical protein